MDSSVEPKIVTEMKKHVIYDVAPNIVKSKLENTEGNIQARVLDISGNCAKIGLYLVDKDDHNKVLSLLGEPQYVKVTGKLTLKGANVVMNFRSLGL